MAYEIPHLWEVGNLHHGCKLSIRGKVHGHQATIALLAGHHPHNPLHHVPLYITLHPHEHRLTFNANKGGEWAGEASAPAPLHPHQHFTLDIHAKHEHFDIHFNGESIHVYEHRHGYQINHITHVLIEGDIHLEEINKH